MTTTTTSSNNSNTKSAAKANVPSHEIFLVEDEIDESDNKTTKWTKVGVAFPTRSGNSHRVFIGRKGDPRQKVYLVCPNSQFDGADDSRPGDEPKRRPYANIFDSTDMKKKVDFTRRDGVAFLNRDDSLSLLIGDKGDAQQQKFQMREVRRFQKRAAKA